MSLWHDCNTQPAQGHELQEPSSLLPFIACMVPNGQAPHLLHGCRRVQNLFHSVQLNVNNPHFLIMQGRITKASPALQSNEKS